jgi:hypothetical protein
MVAMAAAAMVAAACSSSETGAPDDTGSDSAGDSGYVDAGELDGNKNEVDGGFLGPDGSVMAADRLVTTVVSFTPGECAGFGAAKMPEIVEGPPVGGGTLAGSLDVVSLGTGGEIVVSFEPNAIVDGPGTDFLVFENPFLVGGDPNNPAAELGEVSVSEDGITWKTFPCVAASSPPYGQCAGWHPVLSAPGNGISPIDPSVAGGDPFDLADVGLATARYVRIRDMTSEPCPASSSKPSTNGFDLDAVAIVNAANP